jgi:hypothetical protein
MVQLHHGQAVMAFDTLGKASEAGKMLLSARQNDDGVDTLADDRA